MRVMNKLHQWAQHFIPEHITLNKDSLAYQQEFFLFLTLLITTFASFLSIITFAFIGKITLVALTASACLMGVVGLVVWYQTKNIKIPVAIVVGGLMVLNIIAMLQTGGLYSVLVFNFAIPLVLALIYYGPHRMMNIFVVLALTVLVLVIVEMIGVMPAPVFLLTSNALIYGSIILVLLYGIFGAFYIADAIRQESYKELQKERDSVQTRVEEATRNLEEQQENITVINYHLEQRNLELQKAIEIAESAKQLQSDFLRNASHEVRTPLAAIIGFGEILAEQIEENNLPAHESLKFIAEAGQNLLTIFNNILTLSTLESSGIHFSFNKVHLQGLMEQIKEEFTGKMEAKGITFACEYHGEEEKEILSDVFYLRQILHPLISNAIKFTSQGTIKVICEVVSDIHYSEPGWVRWIVQDTGVGIAPEFKEKLFIPFHQYDAGQTRIYGGLGLGLAVTKYLVEAMEGKISCESELGKGTTFIVELPFTELQRA